MKVSLFRKKAKGEGESLVNVEVGDFLESIRVVRKGNCVARFRAVYDQLDDPTHWVGYRHLGRVCPTSEYVRRASGEHEWRLYNGISVLNVVGLNTKVELDVAKRFARLMPQTYCAFEGADGRSLVIWTLSTLPDGSLPAQKELAEMFCAQAYATSVQCDELKNIAQVEHSRHRSLHNFTVNLLSAIAAYCFFPKKPSINIVRVTDNQLTLF